MILTTSHVVNRFIVGVGDIEHSSRSNTLSNQTENTGYKIGHSVNVGRTILVRGSALLLSV